MTAHRALGCLTVLVSAIALAGGSAVASAAAAPAPASVTSGVAPPATADATSPAEAARVDSVAARPSWFDCAAVFGRRTECATVTLPLDYDTPRGPTTEVAILRIRATDPKHRIGSLFLNPGGPGGSGVEFAAAAPQFLSRSLLARFDIVGMDPRGTNYSDDVRCWRDFGSQSRDLSGLNLAFPYTPAEERAAVASAKKFGRACSSTGKPLSAHMATANVARDMDVLRRALGDTKLSYLGFSYGSYLGNVYANLFPDRVRAVTIDGVLDPVAWAGNQANANLPQTMRLRSGEGAAKALDEILRRCGTAGPRYCATAGVGRPQRVYAQIVAALKAEPLSITDPDTGEVVFELSYATLVGFLLGDLYAPEGSLFVDSDLFSVWDLLHASSRGANADASGRAAAARASRALIAKHVAVLSADQAARRQATQGTSALRGYSFPYDNSPEAFQAVLCTDGRNPADAARWPHYADQASVTAPGFGPMWTWASAPCATNTWTVRDRDAYAGPFTHRTAAPVLVVGNFWDPATNYHGAVTAASLLPNSRLLSSDSWGHTAYGTSACVTGAVDRYLLTGAVPVKGTRCVGDVQPFTERLSRPGTPDERRAAPASRALPPVVPPLPGALPRS